MTAVTKPMLLDETGRDILASLLALNAGQAKQTAIMAHEAGISAEAAVFEDLIAMAEAVALGYGPALMPVGSHFNVPYTDVRPGNTTEYSMRWNIMHYGTGQLADGEYLPVAFLQMHHVLPFDTQFSPYQAFLYAIDGLPAGTYNVTMPASWVNSTMQGKTYQFTLAQAIPAGGQIAGFRQCSNAFAESQLKVYAYASQTADTAQETVTATEGSSGTNLGTFSSAGVPVPASGTPAESQAVTIGNTTYHYYGLNSIQRCAWGNNRWLHSPLRQFLNAYGPNWWVPATVFDRPPAYVGYDGFITNLPEDLVEIAKPIRTVTALNYISDGGAAASPETDVTYDKFFLPAWEQHFLNPSQYYGGKSGLEGEAWEWWARAAGQSSPIPASTWGDTATYRMEMVQYDMAANSTPRYAWMRSALRNNACSAACVYSQGYCTYTHAYNGYRAAAACAIGEI